MLRIPRLILIAFALTACRPPDTPPTDSPGPGTDSVAAQEEGVSGEAEEAQGVEEAVADWVSVTEGELTPTEFERLTAAREARAQLGQTLLQTVVAATADGFPSAVRVCHDDAPRLAAEASAPGVQLGRTSHRLRNPDNAAPSWAAAHVARGESTPALFRRPNAVVAELVPISTGPACLNCHGDAERYTPELRATLAALYPEDAATGFAEGDLRGWFWLTAQ